MFELLDGKGTELGVINGIGWLIFLLVKSGALKKMKIWIKIGGNGNGATGKFKSSIVKNSGPGGGQCTSHATALASLEKDVENEKKARETFEKNNRDDHRNIFDKIERILIKLGV